jgi:hypothetical protein
VGRNAVCLCLNLRCSGRCENVGQGRRVVEAKPDESAAVLLQFVFEQVWE